MYERFQELLKEKGCNTAAVARETGIHPSTFTDWKKGKSKPKTDKLQRIADFFGVQIGYLTGDTEYKTRDEELEAIAEFDRQNNPDGQLAREVDKLRRGTRIPVLGRVAAGIPIEMITDIVDWEEISQTMAQKGEYFGLRIKGDSMSPRISEGDTVIVRRQDDAESGDVVIATVNGDSATCKRLMKYQTGISLISFNPIYKPMEFSNKEVATIAVRILGKVVENRQKY